MTEPVCLKIIVDYCAILGAAVGGVTAIVAVYTFWKNARLRQAEWLKTLHAQFYESDRYGKIRRILDYRPQDELDALKAAVQRGDGTSEDFALYLNFFELIASLWKLRQLDLREVKMLFEYYVRLFDEKDLQFVRDYIKKWGFENLQELMAAVQKERPR